MMNILKALVSSFMCMALGISAYAQTSDHDLMFTELYNSEIPGDEGVISLEEGISGDYELLNYNVLGDLDAVEGLDGAVILVRHSEEGDDYYLYAVLSQASFPNPVDYVLLGRDIALLKLTISEGQIIADFVAEGESESYQTSRTIFELDADRLTVVYEGDLDEGHPFVADDVLSAEELGNITYPMDWFDTPFSLTDGIMELSFVTAEGSSTLSYTLDEESIAYGDLNGDGMEDAMVYLAMSRNDSTEEYWVIAAMLNYHGYPQFADSEVDRLGDARLEELSIDENGLVTFRFLDVSHQGIAQMNYRLEDGKLVQVQQ
jgi:hypothetical protein